MTDSAVRHSVYCLIDGERDYQDKLWGGAPHDASKSVGDFIIYMDRFLNKAKELYTTRDSNKPALEEIRKITALGVTCMEYNVTPKRMELPPGIKVAQITKVNVRRPGAAENDE